MYMHREVKVTGTMFLLQDTITIEDGLCDHFCMVIIIFQVRLCWYMKCDMAANDHTAFIQTMALTVCQYDRTFDIESITQTATDYIKNSSKLHPCGINAYILLRCINSAAGAGCRR